MQHLVTTLAVASAAGALVTRQVSTTAGLKAAMDVANYTVGDIEMAAGVYRLADEPAGFGCAVPGGQVANCHICIIRKNLIIRAAAGATVVLDGGNQKGMVYITDSYTTPGTTVLLQGLEITNGYVRTAARLSPSLLFSGPDNCAPFAEWRWRVE